jgi:hypothetical protein
MTALFVARLIERLQNFLAEFGSACENIVDQLGGNVLELRQVFVFFQLEQLMSQEFVFVERRMISGHGGFPR